ncbi:MAG: LPP20 family lipoprotein [Candidatus Desantisbacteria bacterium]
MKKIWLAILIPMLLLSCATDRTMVKEDRPVQQQVAEKAFKELDEETGDRDTVTLTEQEEGVKKPEQPYIPLTPFKGGIINYPLKDHSPIWVHQPNYEGMFGAVGIAKKQEKGGYTAQKRLAVIIAQAELAKQIEVMVDTELQTEKTMINQNYSSKLSSLSRQEAQQLIKNAVVKDEWIQPETGELYVWVVIER